MDAKIVEKFSYDGFGLNDANDEFKSRILTFTPQSRERREAIARLIVAAPDMLAALEGVLLWDDGNLPGDIIDKARVAIDKAKGDV